MNEARAEVFVSVPPSRAFELFTGEIDRWWRRGERYGGPDVEGHRLEPQLGGRFVEVLADGENELGRITVWEPPHRLAFTWRQGNWLPQEVTEVEVRFVSSGAGTQVLLRHHGFDSVSSQVGCEVGYQAGWQELLDWYSEASDAIDQREEETCT